MNQPVTQKASVLVVDDNPLIVNVLSSLLQSEKYQVYTANNGDEALQLLHDKYIDVIVCDVMMPKMDGYHLHEALRRQAEYSHIPFVFLTSLSDSADVMRGKETGADDYLVKPFDPKQLLAVVKGKITRSRNLRNLSDERFDAYRRRVIHTLSHEFRTPLVAINTGTELLIDQREQLDRRKIQELLEAIQRGGQRLEHLVSDFMLLQQIEAGIARRMFENRVQVRPLENLLSEIVESEAEAVQTAGFELKIVACRRGVHVRVYQHQIEDILGRLIDNAVKFSLDKGTIELCGYAEDEWAAIEVRDRGIGMNLEKVKEAVDIFGQIDREKLEQQGGGLGLAIANRYAAIHGGRLEFALREGGGSVASLVLPRVQR